MRGGEEEVRDVHGLQEESLVVHDYSNVLGRFKGILRKKNARDGIGMGCDVGVKSAALQVGDDGDALEQGT